ncbi:MULTISPECIES: type II toxin-antitoxin system RelE/ParE family toxin [Pelosinus]|jgi:mRNA interferase RelE/StbE|uniref:Plasmid stabilization system n=1 Tax=Pelosinus fermentans B4 TaxID=1149862 RepID=I9LK80_9FIRM|nr:MULTISPECIES: type II toxin-antitoxin system RelE/ParE family toxin [Pelosinus]EIW20934.1 plasmid stabilization system [Pelosinus fermentans B4]EIW27199.1 hypothetical protein FA11_1218 [Pelosinus fermentans A11]OAM92882.1 plasmid stabilization system [Pelosinus fermentans DSM 17108]SDQ59834.1 mRNA interferase RelE/StbE [Pelosinus fermentans]
MYQLIFLPPAEKYFKKLKDKNLKQKYKNALEEIQKDPYIGEEKSGDLSGMYGYDIYYNKTNYEIAYRIYNLTDGGKVIVIMAGTRENFWDTLKRYIK